jgi:hypothetical protein
MPRETFDPEGPHSPTNRERARWAARALEAFARVAGTHSEPKTEPEDTLVDLLADLMHWCDARTARHRPGKTVGFEAAVATARGHHQWESHQSASRSQARRGLKSSSRAL